MLVSAINPTPAGEGKTTVTIGLTQAARKLGIRAAAALRQSSQGPVFGVKGGGTGGGQATLVPLERINLHFTGDIHAVTAAHNLLAALADNDCYFGGEKLDPRQITWRRSMDMNERFLCKVIIGLGGKSDGLLRDALLPNIAQTIEGAPVLVHGGPFGNIAHGCNSIVATKAALRHSDLVFTEGGFGFDLGAEKFLNIKCRAGGIWPNTVVLVATVRALKMHGGASLADMANRNPEALEKGMANLDKHIESVRAYGLWGQRGGVLPYRQGPIGEGRCAGLRELPGLHGQNPFIAIRRSEEDLPAPRLHHQCQGNTRLGRRGIPGLPDRGNHDHAGFAQGSALERYRPYGGRGNRRGEIKAITEKSP